MMYENLREESQKLKVASDWFPKFDCTDIIKRIDFAVKIKRDAVSIDFEDEYLLWAEAKQQPTDVYQMLAQLILTIKADAYDRVPPKFIGCFDCEKIAFVEYHYVLPIYNVNDFNWTQTPSAVDDKTVETVKNTIDANRIFTFYFDTDRTELKNFIKANFSLDANTNLFSTLIDKNNFIFVYQKWQKMVMPYITADWDSLKKNYSIYDRDFFLAELNIDDNSTTDLHDDRIVNRDFYITFDSKAEKPYQLKRTDNFGMEFIIPFGFKKDGLRHYTDFWKRYRRPPQNEYWDYIVERVDLLVPQDVRERKGSFFTPQKWVEKSQQYLAKVLGDNWQDEYYIWDCCAGTGNMEVGLTNKYNVWASTIDQQDVDIMKDQITKKGFNLLENHVFQFDFLNDDFSKCPQGLQNIINDPEKRKKLVIYINPPYAEGTTATTVTGTGSNKAGVATTHKTYEKYKNIIGKATNEVYAQFFIRIYKEIPSATLAEFSTLKLLQSISFKEFRKVFQAKLEKAFVVPSKTFDNVNGNFPIGFLIWNTQKKDVFNEILTDAFDAQENYIGQRKFQVDDENSLPLNNWLKHFYETKDNSKGLLDTRGNDFANQRYVYLTHQSFIITAHSTGIYISEKNILPISIYLAVRQIIPASWLNNKDQFLYPNDGWKTDAEFQTNCLIYTLFHGQNKISATQGINHWIPFTESQVNAKERFESHFMSDFLAGKIKVEKPKDLFSDDASAETQCNASLQFTNEAKAVLNAGRELWRYYHEQPDANPNASLYDIKEYFKGRDKNGRMKNSSDDARYNELFENLQEAMKQLGASIQPKVYDYGFLK